MWKPQTNIQPVCVMNEPSISSVHVVLLVIEISLSSFAARRLLLGASLGLPKLGWVKLLSYSSEVDRKHHRSQTFSNLEFNPVLQNMWWNLSVLAFICAIMDFDCWCGYRLKLTPLAELTSWLTSSNVSVPPHMTMSGISADARGSICPPVALNSHIFSPCKQFQNTDVVSCMTVVNVSAAVAASA